MHAELLCARMQEAAWWTGSAGVQYSTLRNLMRQACPDLRTTMMHDDLKFIEQAIRPDARYRPSPGQAMEFDCFANQSDTDAFEQMEFPVGSHVLYRSRSLRKEVPCTVKEHRIFTATRGGAPQMYKYVLECPHAGRTLIEAEPNRVRAANRDANIDHTHLRVSQPMPTPAKDVTSLEVGDLVNFKLEQRNPWKIMSFDPSQGSEGRYLIQYYHGHNQYYASAKWLVKVDANDFQDA